jgi:NADPH:quinone reductase-like Zn-dependent oxidoreductase
MKAIVQHAYGSADALEFTDIKVPTVRDDEVLIRIRAAGLHIGDWHVMTGLPYMLRVVGFGFLAPKVKIRGMDVAGIVASVGKQVTEFRVGDSVFGTCQGSSAECARAPVKNLAPRPSNLTFEQAAVIPTSAFAALQALRNRGEIQRGQQVLIIGATGAVGNFAVQLAMAFGAEVTGVCGTAKTDALRALGINHVIDYNKEDFTKGDRRYDLVLETGGNRPLSDLRRVLKPNGILVLVGAEGGNRVLGSTGKWIHALLLSAFVRQRLRPLSTSPNQSDLLILKGLIEDGKLTPTIDRSFSLSEVPDAFRYLQRGLGVGKVVITVSRSEGS